MMLRPAILNNRALSCQKIMPENMIDHRHGPECRLPRCSCMGTASEREKAAK
jgi:hypothetical protein